MRSVSPFQRLRRMRRMFAKSRAILRKNYNFFMRPPTKTNRDDGKRLTDAAHTYGSVDLYVGDDGKIHA
jgi:hypothetical protein